MIHKRRLTSKEINEIKELLNKGFPITGIAEAYNVPRLIIVNLI